MNDNFFKAYLGFYEMGFETVFFHDYEVLKSSKREDIVVGYVGTVKRRLMDFAVEFKEVDYPAELQEFLGRRVWHSTINDINASPDLWPLFVKPIENKKFTGVVVNTPKDLIGCGSCYEIVPVICSEVVNFLAEWRVFIRYGKILDVRPYKGDWRVHFDPNIIEQAVKQYVTAPAGYALDFGVTDDGRTLLIEANDGYALGSYGLFYPQYAKLLSARWAEFTGTKDECDFEMERFDFYKKKKSNNICQTLK